MTLDQMKSITANALAVAEKLAAPVRLLSVGGHDARLYLDLVDFRRVFAGQEVELRIDGNRDVYTIVIDGVKVEADQYVSGRGAAQTTRVTLPMPEPSPFVPDTEQPF